MIVNFVGNYQFGYVGEVSDETHLARELEDLGHTVNRIPRDVFKAWCEGEETQPDWILPIKADINLIAKWDKFDQVDYIDRLRASSNAPVFYWVWDYMLDPIFPEWHLKMARSADLYLSGELGLTKEYRELGVKFYYFQMDVCDPEIETFDISKKDYDVVFTGSYLGQGDRIKFLTEINKALPGKLKIFSWNYEEWKKQGFDAYPAIYGEEYNNVIARSKVVLGLSVEAHCYGYWSNRVGKVLRAGGRLLQQYAPGMETMLPTCVTYFSTPEEAVEKIQPMLNGYLYCLPRSHYDSTSRIKMISLVTLMERFLIEDWGRGWKLP